MVSGRISPATGFWIDSVAAVSLPQRATSAESAETTSRSVSLGNLLKFAFNFLTACGAGGTCNVNIRRSPSVILKPIYPKPTKGFFRQLAVRACPNSNLENPII
jgi:hypothetical protein